MVSSRRKTVLELKHLLNPSIISISSRSMPGGKASRNLSLSSSVGAFAWGDCGIPSLL